MFVRQLVGPQAGQIIEMPYLAGQNCIDVGTAKTVTEEEIAEEGLEATEYTAPLKADEMPLGYRVEESEGGGFDVLDPGGVVLTGEIEIPNMVVAREFAQKHFLDDAEAAKQPDTAPVDATVEIEWQEDWRDAHWATQVKLAKQFDENVSTKAEAVAVLESVEARRADQPANDQNA